MELAGFLASVQLTWCANLSCKMECVLDVWPTLAAVPPQQVLGAHLDEAYRIQTKASEISFCFKVVKDGCDDESTIVSLSQGPLSGRGQGRALPISSRKHQHSPAKRRVTTPG